MVKIMHNLSKEELILKIKELEEKVHDLEKDLSQDKLTSLKNRAFFEDKSKAYLDSASKIKEYSRRDWMGFHDICFMFFDIDYFKSINDTYGHNVGDTVLATVSKVLKKDLRVGDIVARWGGEEFVAVLLGANEEQAKLKAEQIRKEVESLVFDEHKDLKVTISIGISEFNGDFSFEELIEHADKALYVAKDTGRNKVVTFSEIKK